MATIERLLNEQYFSMGNVIIVQSIWSPLLHDNYHHFIVDKCIFYLFYLFYVRTYWLKSQVITWNYLTLSWNVIKYLCEIFNYVIHKHK